MLVRRLLKVCKIVDSQLTKEGNEEQEGPIGGGKAERSHHSFYKVTEYPPGPNTILGAGDTTNEQK